MSKSNQYCIMYYCTGGLERQPQKLWDYWTTAKRRPLLNICTLIGRGKHFYPTAQSIQNTGQYELSLKHYKDGNSTSTAHRLLSPGFTTGAWMQRAESNIVVHMPRCKRQLAGQWRMRSGNVLSDFSASGSLDVWWQPRQCLYINIWILKNIQAECLGANRSICQSREKA